MTAAAAPPRARLLPAILARALPLWGVVALWLAAGSTTVAWLRADTTPPSWDPAVHLSWSLLYVAYLEQLPPSEALAGIAATSDYYPPLVHVAAALVLRRHGALEPDLPGLSTADLATLANLGFLLLLLLSVFALANRFHGPLAGLVAAFLASCYPILAGHTRTLLLDFPLTALVTWYLALLAASRGLTHRGWPWLAGLAAGAGMLCKWSFAPLVAAPTVVALVHGWQRVRQREARPEQLVFGTLVTLIVAVCVAGPWYLSHLDRILAEIATSNQTWRIDGDPAPWTLAGLAYYPAALLRGQLFVPFCTLAACGAWLAWRRRAEVAGTELLAAWFLGGLVACWLVPNKDPRFTMPLLPALAVLSTSWLAPRGLRHGPRLVLLVATVVLGGWQFQAIAFGLGALPARLGPAAAPVWSSEAHFTGHPSALDWPHEALARDIVAATPAGGVCGVLPNTAHLNFLTVRYQVARLLLPLPLGEDRRIKVRPVVGAQPASLASLRESELDTLVLLDGDQGAHAAAIDATMAALRRDPTALWRSWERVARYTLPGGEELTLYRRRGR